MPSMLLQGEAGTTVDLSVVRVRRPEPQTVKLTRAVTRAAAGRKQDAGRPGRATSISTRSRRRT